MQRSSKILANTALMACLSTACGNEPTQTELPISEAPASPSEIDEPNTPQKAVDLEATNDPDIDDTLPDGDDGRAVEQNTDPETSIETKPSPETAPNPESANNDNSIKPVRLSGNPPANMFEIAPPHLHQAIRDAQEQLDIFWTGLETREPGNQTFFITAGFTDATGKLEIIRMTPVARNGDIMTGTANSASKALVGKINVGDSVMFTTEDVYNWRFVKGMRIVGGFIKQVEEANKTKPK